MHGKMRVPKSIRFVALNGKKYKPNAIRDSRGNLMYVDNADIIRIISDAFGARYDVLTPGDQEYGRRLSGGNWTGMIGMLQRGECDIGLTSAVTEERTAAVHFTYPLVISDATFATDKPQPHSLVFAIFLPFSPQLWTLLILVLIIVSFLLYVVTRRTRSLNRILVTSLGNMLEQSASYDARTPSAKILALVWVLFCMFVSYSYKALLSSFLTFPTMIGIFDVADLSKAATKGSVQCFSYSGSYLTRALLESTDASLRTIGECLKLQEALLSGEEVESAFRNSGAEKVFVSGRKFLSHFKRDYMLSKDSLSFAIFSAPYSKEFCCPERLERTVQRIVETGLYEKYQREVELFDSLATAELSPVQSKTAKGMTVRDVSGTLFILLSGYLLSAVCLAVEILLNRSPRDGVH